MSWENRLKERLKPAIRKDGWDYDIVEADADGFFKVLNEFITELLKEQREKVVDNILMGFGVGTIEDHQISIIKNNGLKAPEPE